MAYIKLCFLTTSDTNKHELSSPRVSFITLRQPVLSANGTNL